MRLFDKVVTTNFNIAQILRQPDIVVVDCDAVNQYFVTSKSSTAWDEKQSPYARLPYKKAFYEWHTLDDLNRPAQIGFAIGESSPPDETIVGELPIGSDDVMLSGMLVGEIGGRLVDPRTVFNSVMDATGSVLHTLISTDGSFGINDKALYDLLPLWQVVLLANTFLNCANVKLDDATEALQPPPKIRRRLGIPEVKRYTLNIAGHTTRPVRDRADFPLLKNIMPHHLCRGHFAEYTAEKPLFGNPKLVGRYWHPPHMRGDKKNGEIIKNYALKG